MAQATMPQLRPLMSRARTMLRKLAGTVPRNMPITARAIPSKAAMIPTLRGLLSCFQFIRLDQYGLSIEVVKSAIQILHRYTSACGLDVAHQELQRAAAIPFIFVKLGGDVHAHGHIQRSVALAKSDGSECLMAVG